MEIGTCGSWDSMEIGIVLATGLIYDFYWYPSPIVIQQYITHILQIPLYYRFGDTVQFRVSVTLHQMCRFANVSSSDPLPILPMTFMGPRHPDWASWHIVTSLSVPRFPPDEPSVIEFLKLFELNVNTSMHRFPQFPLFVMSSSLGTWDGERIWWILSLHILNERVSTNSSQWITLFTAVIPSHNENGDSHHHQQNWWKEVYKGEFDRISLAALVTGTTTHKCIRPNDRNVKVMIIVHFMYIVI